MRVLVRRIPAVFVCLLLATAFAAAKDLAVVSNKANSVQDLTLPDLAKICKGQTTHWPDGKPVTFVMMAPSSPDMKALVLKVYEVTPTDVDGIISSANHERKNHPAIVVVTSPEAVVQKVESTPGALGVVDVYSITSGVTVLKVAGKLPLQPGYSLHGN
jgi:ABC-type phosphate transport system substrate-binding protein